jgi:hypothetical protein
MPIHLKIIRATEFLIAAAQGQIDFKVSQRLLSALASAATTRQGHEVLLDMRNAQSALSASDLWNLAAELNRGSATMPRKIAVLSQMSASSQAAFFALCAKNSGIRIQAFTSFEEAVQWLSTSEQETAEHTI